MDKNKIVISLTEIQIIIGTLRDSLTIGDNGKIFNYSAKDRNAVMADLYSQLNKIGIIVEVNQ
jgi:hypothetical protein